MEGGNRSLSVSPFFSSFLSLYFSKFFIKYSFVGEALAGIARKAIRFNHNKGLN